MGGGRGTEESHSKSSFDLVINSVGFTSWRDEWDGIRERSLYRKTAHGKINATRNEIVLSKGRKKSENNEFDRRYKIRHSFSIESITCRLLQRRANVFIVFFPLTNCRDNYFIVITQLYFISLTILAE